MKLSIIISLLSVLLVPAVALASNDANQDWQHAFHVAPAGEGNIVLLTSWQDAAGQPCEQSIKDVQEITTGSGGQTTTSAALDVHCGAVETGAGSTIGNPSERVLMHLRFQGPGARGDASSDSSIEGVIGRPAPLIIRTEASDGSLISELSVTLLPMNSATLQISAKYKKGSLNLAHLGTVTAPLNHPAEIDLGEGYRIVVSAGMGESGHEVAVARSVVSRVPN